METRKLADWLQILGNVGIFIGLFFVGFQLYQDRQLKQAELTAGYFEARIMANAVAMGENPQKSIVKAATNPDAMTAEDSYVFFLNLDNWTSLWLRQNSLAKLGFEGSWQDWSGMSLEFGSPMGIRYIEGFLSGSGNYLPEEFTEKLRKQLNDPGIASVFEKRLEHLLGEPPLPQP